MSMTPSPTLIASLKQIQTQLFQTSYNPLSLRTGSKYLRRRLRGPSMIARIPPTLNLRKLMEEETLEKFGPVEKSDSSSSSSSLPTIKGYLRVHKDRPIRPKDDAGFKVWQQYEDSLLAFRSGKSSSKLKANTNTNMITASDGTLVKQKDVAEGFIEVERDETAGLFRDEKEWVRQKEVEERRIAGRGPPKKGQGRRSQMKKK